MITLIAAVGENRIIGNKGELPWQLPADMKWFRQQTTGKPVVMGRKTFDALNRKPLPKRTNIIISRQADELAAEHEDALWATSLTEALALAGLQQPEEIMIIGGGQIYTEALPLADRLYITEVAAKPEGDAMFPVFNEKEWRKTILDVHAAKDEQPAFVICQYDRIK